MMLMEAMYEATNCLEMNKARRVRGSESAKMTIDNKSQICCRKLVSDVDREREMTKHTIKEMPLLGK